MCLAGLKLWMSWLYGKLNKELKLLGSVQAKHCTPVNMFTCKPLDLCDSVDGATLKKSTNSSYGAYLRRFCSSLAVSMCYHL